MSDKSTEPSTLNAALNSVGAAAQSLLGSVTGSEADKAQAAERKDKAELEHEASQAGASVGGVSVSASGVAANDPKRAEGSWNQTVGSGKELLGNLVGSEQLKRDGAEQNAAGQGQQAQGQLNDLSSGIADRVKGTVGGAVAGLTGDVEAQKASKEQHDRGKTLERGVESELQKQAEAERK